MNLKKNMIRILGGMAASFAVYAAYAVKPMPSKFTLNQEAGKILQGYPLGIINQQDAFSHHGPPLKKIILPNGNWAWLYKV